MPSFSSTPHSDAVASYLSLYRFKSVIKSRLGVRGGRWLRGGRQARCQPPKTSDVDSALSATLDCYNTTTPSRPRRVYST